jgi:hypothetical protein
MTGGIILLGLMQGFSELHNHIVDRPNQNVDRLSDTHGSPRSRLVLVVSGYQVANDCIIL